MLPSHFHCAVEFSDFYLTLELGFWGLFFADAVYTERYMGKPVDNSDSYNVNIIHSVL